MNPVLLIVRAGVRPWKLVTTWSASSRGERPFAAAVFCTFSPCSSVPVRKKTCFPSMRGRRGRRGLGGGAGPARLPAGVRIVLVDQAAHQPPADPGELRRVERQLLVLRHLDRDRLEVAQEGRAAELPAARSEEHT